VETLQGDGPFTVFAPTDAAFAALPAGTVEALLADIPALTNILTYHVAGGKKMSTDLSDGQMIATVNGKEIKVTINEAGVFINNAKVTVANLEADNGVVHVIDAVLIPSALPATVVDIVINSEAHTTLEAAVVAAGLVETLQGDGPFTVFAPTDAAFGALLSELGVSSLDDIDAATLEAVLKMHVIEGKVMSSDLSEGLMATTLLGENVTFSLETGAKVTDPNGRSSNITAVDIEAQNGVVHVIDKVILPKQTQTGIDDLDVLGLKVYPNPASQYIMIQSNDSFGIFILRDITGKMVMNQKIESNNERIDIASLKSGLYFGTLETAKMKSTVKVIVQ
jgi:transforming growth factor-beta-induced protein